MTQIEFLQEHGIHPVGTPRNGFRSPRAPPSQLDRIRSLRLPPAWKDVAISPNPRARLRAVGRDKKGRWQYVYSDAAVREREQKKFDRLLAFGRALPKMRRTIDQGMRLRGRPYERVIACILGNPPTRGMRAGSAPY